MKSFHPLLITACLILPLLIGCGRGEVPPPGEAPLGEGAEVHTVRGVYQGPRFEGQAASIEHEAIPGVMDAMRMDFRLEDSAEVEPFSPGDKVRFELVVTRGDAMARGFERLPDTTRLALPSGASDAAR